MHLQLPSLQDYDAWLASTSFSGWIRIHAALSGKMQNAASNDHTLPLHLKVDTAALVLCVDCSICTYHQHMSSPRSWPVLLQSEARYPMHLI